MKETKMENIRKEMYKATNPISSATARNWERLGTDKQGRLTKRANKRNSKKRIIPYEYILEKENISVLEKITDIIISKSYDYTESIYTLCIGMLKAKGIINNINVQKVISEYSKNNIIEELSEITLPDNEYDFLGVVYQSLLSEGNKNSMGSYYTPIKVVSHMTDGLNFSQGQTFLDPCCGSGSFLLSLKCSDPELIYGIDNDPIAVMIAKVNLLCKYPDNDFIPYIYCTDFLKDDIFSNKKFDYIYTNPPWGAVNNNTSAEISSDESFSIFFVHSFYKLKTDGLIRFLLPQSVLNVRVHKDIRKFILDKCCLKSVTFYSESFTGVLTSCIDILAGNSAAQENIEVIKDNEKYTVKISAFRKTENLIFNMLTEKDIEIIEKVKQKSPYNLSESIWALGIVTGNNKEKLLSEKLSDTEPIFTGKEISEYVLMPAKNYIHYDRNTFQQVAKDEIYRADEKLVYKFISHKLVFAYDNSKSLFLNSANILIPVIKGMSVKTVMAFLNSNLYSFLYKKLFGEIKILKGNLTALPFPKITEEKNQQIEQYVDLIMQTNDKFIIEKLQTIIYNIFDLNADEINYITSQTENISDNE